MHEGREATDTMGSTTTRADRLQRIDTIDLPVVEASGVGTRRVDGGTKVIVVGDRTAHVASATYSPREGVGDWQLVDLAASEHWSDADSDSQFEAVASDGGSLVAVMREDPPEVFVVDTEAKRLHARLSLTAPKGSPAHGKWDDPSSRGEGMVMLRDGRLLVAQEKRPRALIEFAPRGRPAQGLSRSDFLDGESWACPTGVVEYVAVARWRLRGRAKDQFGDISDLDVGPDGSLWLMSDQSRAVARLTLEVPLVPGGDEIQELPELWRLPKGTTKPEGIAAVEPRRAIVAMDTRSTEGNGILVGPPE